MNDHALRVLEFDKVREIVSGFAASEPGKTRVGKLVPESDFNAAALRLSETRESLYILHSEGRIPLDGIADIGHSIAKLAAKGAMLAPHELSAIASTMAAGRKVFAFFRNIEQKNGAGHPTPNLSAVASRIVPLPQLEEAIHKSIDDSGNIKDSASAELRRLRRQIVRTREEILAEMERILRDARNVVMEPVITIRDDRYVIPLKPTFRQSIRGVVHGQSGSRATVFVEPLEVLEQNNILAELHMDEREEVERILRELSALASRDISAIEASLGALAEIDAVFARAQFGIKFHGIVPELSEKQRVRLCAARHPLLVWKTLTSGAPETVPNDIEIDEARRVLIISGPNAGGKTVLLKTIGLLCLMAQAGIPVTAAEGSKLAVFSDFFADIGDEQSLEQNLSTFSSHVRRIAEILQKADSGSLVMLDELGAGTDPAEGAALGSAVLNNLLRRGCTTVVTTHHGSLKLFGSTTDGAANGAVEFDPLTLKPTYRFFFGRPGRSYGLDMAERLGVPDSVVRDARSRMSESEAGLDSLLAQIESDSRRIAAQRDAALAAARAAEESKAEAEAIRLSAIQEARNIRAQAAQQAQEVLGGLRQKLKELSSAKIAGISVNAVRREVNALAEKLNPEPLHEEAASTPPYEFFPGNRVRLPKLKKTGTVLFVHKNNLEIESNGLKLQVPVRDAVLLKEKPEHQLFVGSGWRVNLAEREGPLDCLNIIGMYTDEAVESVARFIDRAVVHGFRQITVIHGLGTGALKDAVTAFLKGHALVASLRPGEAAEGGHGVTVAELKP